MRDILSDVVICHHPRNRSTSHWNSDIKRTAGKRLIISVSRFLPILPTPYRLRNSICQVLVLQKEYGAWRSARKLRPRQTYENNFRLNWFTENRLFCTECDSLHNVKSQLITVKPYLTVLLLLAVVGSHYPNWDANLGQTIITWTLQPFRYLGFFLTTG